ncbi:MAG: protein kinase [Chloroflexi bacterium]|nr:protein kinase [Chloroflexota bacterium]
MATDRIQRQIDRLLDEAEDGVSRLDWEVVRDRARAVLVFDPDNRDAQGFLAAAERALGPGSDLNRTVLDETPAPEPRAPTPTMFKEGRYVVKGLLGEGARKRVYLVHDTLLDREVAFALIKTQGLDDVGRERVLIEAQSMAQLGDHSNIVQLHDLGEEGRQPFLVMPVMAGGDVDRLLRESPEHRLTPKRAIEIASDVSRGLEFAHSRGIVHRDLKPDNVWLTADGTAKIGDFGLVLVIDRTRFTQADVILGTLAYMSPEQSMGAKVDGRSDLYSLGCMLYQMVTGAPPFSGDDPQTIISQHLNTPPVSPAWHNPGVTPSLEAIILRLLEKDPTRRPSSATEVRKALESIREGEAGQPSLEEAPVQRSRLAPVYRRTFVGREAELKELHTAFDRAMSGDGSLVLVVGEPGIGKTALCEQLGTYVTLRGGKTLMGRSYEEGSLSVPYLPFVEALRAYVSERDVDDLRRELGPNAGDVGRLVTEVRERLDVEPSSPGHPEEDIYRLMQAVTSFVRSATVTQPLLIVLEDLQDSDKGTLDMLAHLARNLSGARLLVVGTYREVEVHRGHPLSETLTQLRRTSSFSRIALRGLSAEEVQQMMDSSAVQEISSSLAEAVHGQTEGNPLFVQEVLRYLVEEGLLTREGRPITGQTQMSLAIPEGLRDVIGKRLSRLSPECNRVLRIAAVIGREFRLDVLQKVVDVSEDELFTALEEAKNVVVVEEHASVGGVVTFRFTHAFFRQTLYEESIAPRRIRIHQQVGRAIEEVHATRLEAHAPELAEHFSNSSDAEDLGKAVRYAEIAADRAKAVFAFPEAMQLLEQALQVHEVLAPDDGERRCDLLLELGDTMMSAGEPRRAFETVAPEAFALAESLEDRQRASCSCQLALTALIRYGSGTMAGTPDYNRWAKRADHYALPDTIERVHADRAMSAFRYAEGNRKESWTLAKRALELARRLDDPETLFFGALGILGRPQAPEHLEEQLRLAEEFAGRPREGVRARTAGVVSHLCGFAHLALGERPRADELWFEVGELAVRTDDTELILLSLSTEPMMATLDGHLEHALKAAERLFEKAKELGSPVLGRQFVDEATFRPLLYLGRAEKALDSLARACEMAGLDPDWEISLQRVLCLAHLHRRGEARDALDELILERDIGPEADETPATFLATLLEAAVLIGERQAAEVLASRLSGLASLAADSSYLTCIARHLGGAAALLGEPDEARDYYRTAIGLTEKIRNRPEAALSRFELSQLLYEKYPGENEEARRHLQFAIAEFRDMKMVSALERALRNGTGSA